MKKTVLFLALLAVITLTGNIAYAVTLPFDDGFEGAAPDTVLATPWYGGEGDFYYTDTAAAEGDQSAKVDPSVSRQANLDITTDATVIELTWWYKSYINVIADRRLLNVTLDDSWEGKQGPYLRTIKDPNSNRYVQYYTGSSWQNITTWTQGVWYEMKIVLAIDPDDDVKNDTWDFYMRTPGNPWTQYKDDIVTRDDIDQVDFLQFFTTSDGFAGRGGFYIDDVRVHGTPQQCGDPGTVYFLSDINHDCYINFADFAMLAEQWLDRNDPNNSYCD